MQDENNQIEGAVIESDAPVADAPQSTETSVSESQGSEKGSLLDAVLEVVKPTSEDGETTDPVAQTSEEVPASEDKPEGEDQAEGAEEKSDTDPAAEAEEEPDKDLPASTRKKVDKLLKDRRELRKHVAQLEGPATVGSELQNFAMQHDLSVDDITNALHIAATLRRGDYDAFYEMVSPYVRHAQEYKGIVLPEDLAQMVRDNQITEQAARQFARTRFDQQRLQVENTRMNDLSQQYFVGQVQQNVQRAVSDYEAQIAARDPDYKAKAGLVQRTAGALLREKGGSVSSPEEAISIVKAAYEEVNRQVRAFAPPPRATRPSPSGTNPQTPSARTAPKSLMDAVKMGLERSRAG